MFMYSTCNNIFVEKWVPYDKRKKGKSHVTVPSLRNGCPITKKKRKESQKTHHINSVLF